MRSAVLLVAMLAIGCEGPAGPPGPPGADGMDGRDGMDGERGASGPAGDGGAAAELSGALAVTEEPPGANCEHGGVRVDGDEATHYICNGEPGMDGADGAPGPAGDAGTPAGPGYRPLVWFGCGAALDLISGGGLGQDGVAETTLSYLVTRYSNGDLEVRCEAGVGSAESGANSAYFPATANGASGGHCNIFVDYPPTDSTAGLWAFRIDDAGPYAMYDDDSVHPMDGDVFSFDDATCNALQMDDAGEWQDIAWADIFD